MVPCSMEAEFIAVQDKARNLTTYVGYPLPGKILEVP